MPFTFTVACNETVGRNTSSGASSQPFDGNQHMHKVHLGLTPDIDIDIDIDIDVDIYIYIYIYIYI